MIGVAKIASGVAVALGLVGLLIWSLATARNRAELAANASLSIAKQWPTITGAGLLDQMKFTLRTVWRGGRIYYQFSAAGYADAANRAKHPAASLTVMFLDADGFKALEKRIGLSEMFDVVDQDGKPTGMDWKGDEYLDAATYRRLSSWNFSWSGLGSVEVAHPPAPSTPKSHLPSTRWQQLQFGMSRSAVTELLGPPDKTDLVGPNGENWYYGKGGVVKFGSDGLARTWTEP